MANILVLKSSILGQYSQSNALIDGFLADHQDDAVTVRDLAALNLPVLDGDLLMGVISFLDVAKAVLEEQSFENKMLKSYIKNWPDEQKV